MGVPGDEYAPVLQGRRGDLDVVAGNGAAFFGIPPRCHGGDVENRDRGFAEERPQLLFVPGGAAATVQFTQDHRGNRDLRRLTELSPLPDFRIHAANGLERAVKFTRIAQAQRYASTRRNPRTVRWWRFTRAARTGVG